MELYIDLKPALSNEKLDARIQRDFGASTAVATCKRHERFIATAIDSCSL